MIFVVCTEIRIHLTCISRESIFFVIMVYKDK
jgi:hypothetical protein